MCSTYDFFSFLRIFAIVNVLCECVGTILVPQKRFKIEKNSTRSSVPVVIETKKSVSEIESTNSHKIEAETEANQLTKHDYKNTYHCPAEDC